MNLSAHVTTSGIVGAVRRVLVVLLATLVILGGALALHSVAGTTDLTHAVASAGDSGHQADHAAAPIVGPGVLGAQGGAEPLQACDADCGRARALASLACVLLLVLTVITGLPRGPQGGRRWTILLEVVRRWASGLRAPVLTPSLLSLSISRT